MVIFLYNLFIFGICLKTVLYPKLCYTEQCYKEVCVYLDTYSGHMLLYVSKWVIAHSRTVYQHAIPVSSCILQTFWGPLRCGITKQMRKNLKIQGSRKTTLNIGCPVALMSICGGLLESFPLFFQSSLGTILKAKTLLPPGAKGSLY